MQAKLVAAELVTAMAVVDDLRANLNAFTYLALPGHRGPPELTATLHRALNLMPQPREENFSKIEPIRDRWMAAFQDVSPTPRPWWNSTKCPPPFRQDRPATPCHGTTSRRRKSLSTRSPTAIRRRISPGGVSPPGARRTGRETLASSGSHCSAISLQQPPVSKQQWLASRDASHPVLCSPPVPSERLELPMRPSCQYAVDVA